MCCLPVASGSESNTGRRHFHLDLGQSAIHAPASAAREARACPSTESPPNKSSIDERAAMKHDGHERHEHRHTAVEHDYEEDLVRERIRNARLYRPNRGFHQQGHRNVSK